MKIIVYYNKNLKMSEGKLAAQVGHVCKNIGEQLGFMIGCNTHNENPDIIIVLGLRKNKFIEKLEETKRENNFYYIQKDLGYTEVEKGTITAFGCIEDEK